MKRAHPNRPAGLRGPEIRSAWPRRSLILASGTLTYYYVSFSRLIDARLHGERERTLPRVYARPLVLRQGQAIGQQDLIARLNDLGYAQRGAAEAPGEFAIGRNAVAIKPRSTDFGGRPIRVSFPARGATHPAASRSVGRGTDRRPSSSTRRC